MGTALQQARRRIARRPARDRIVEHLEACHQIKVAAVTQLDLGVYRVSRPDGPAWVARIFPAIRPAEAAQGDGEILQQLAALGYPAERPAATEPASAIAGGCCAAR